MTRIAVLGAGAWGTALAIPAVDNGHEVRLWIRDPRRRAAVRQSRSHPALPEAALPDAILLPDEPAEAIAGAEVVVIAASSSGIRDVCRTARLSLDPASIVLSITKGIDPDTLKPISEVIREELGPRRGPMVVLSGPNFAVEVARRMATATVVASENAEAMSRIQELLMTRHFRVYTNPDVRGVELGGALKNVIALGVGMADGLGVGQNARAALITRGLAEIARLGIALGAAGLTFAGLSGLGDLVATCTGHLSRNRLAGELIGKGEAVEAVLGRPGFVVEGARTVKAVVELSTVVGVEMPISRQIYEILYRGKRPIDGVRDLMIREKTREMEEVAQELLRRPER